MSIRSRLILAIALAAAAFHLWAAGVSPYTALVQRPVHLLFMAVLGFLGVGVVASRPREDDAAPAAAPSAARTRADRWIAPLLIAAVVLSFGYLVVQHEALVRRSGLATVPDLIAGGIAILAVLELTRRATGWGLVAVGMVALVYAWAGPWLPGVLAHRGYAPKRIIEHLYLTAEGIWGIPLGVSADFVYLFVLFGAVLEAAGGGAMLIALAARVAGRQRGAPAMTAAVASAFMGSISGSAVANVVTTGTFTIPLMKRAGFRPHFAGAIEAAASTGGQIMPPVMGAGAFILATWTGIPYARVALAALVPAILYYVALVSAIRFRAEKMKLPTGEAIEREPLLPRLHLLAPLAVIIFFLATGRSPMRAAFWGVVSGLIAALARRATRLDTGAAQRAVIAGASSTVQVAAACATAGIVVGVASLTGIGLRMSELIITLSGGHLSIALLLTAAGSIVLGMGLPTTAAYVVLAALGAPALVQLGVPLLAAHLFIFYFGCISNVTPPVALAAYAAAGLSGADPMRTAWTAAALAAAGFIVPFMFVYGPPLLLVGPAYVVAGSIVTATIGVTGLAAAIIGHARSPLAAWERLVVAGGALALIFPGWITDAIGLAVLAVFLPRRPRTAIAAEPAGTARP
ncbi:MAG: TRAP transporter fused permease subunit [Gemmatimonadetes bacterium]|nr:TRAP transporter fused permease subunit [Gemmatimonadota bacterium]